MYTAILLFNWYGIQRGSAGGSVVKNPPAMQETQEVQVRSLGWEDSLEKEMGNPPSMLAWSLPLPEEPGGLQSSGAVHGVAKSQT